MLGSVLTDGWSAPPWPLLFGATTLALALYLSYRLLTRRHPAAFPGGPRARRIYRAPKWPRNDKNKVSR